MEALLKKDFYFDLPEELIAQDPLADRSGSRLLVLNKETGEIAHKVFTDIVDYLHEGDCLVLNNTKVIPARLMGEKKETGAAIEVLLLKRREHDVWETLVKPGKKARVGAQIVFGGGLLAGTVIDVIEEGNRLIQFSYEGIFEEVLDKLGEMPLPPYITHKLADKNRYQTVYAKLAYVTLHVGLGTFRPVKEDNLLNHHMHSEWYEITPDAAELINSTKQAGGRVICVGTTSCRTIESAADESGSVVAGNGDTEIFIYPGYRFKVLDNLITNFHLPESTLIMLVSALAGREHVLNAYRTAVLEKYRFFSFGDAMFIE